MTFEKLTAAARAMSAAEQQATLKQLCEDARGAAVLKLLMDEKELVSDSASQLKFANSHGCLAHAAGARYNLLELEGKLRAVCTPEKVRRKAAAPPEAEPEE